MGRAGAALQAWLVLGRFGSGTCHHPRCVFAVRAGFMGFSLPLLALQGCPAVALGAAGTTLLLGKVQNPTCKSNGAGFAASF